MAGARALAIILVAVTAWACSPTNTPLHAPTASSQTSTTDLASQATSPVGSRCGDSRGDSHEPTYAFPKVSIQLGSDYCQEIGQLADPQFLSLTNDGPLVAFNARDVGDNGNLWFGDLRTQSIKVVYKAPQAAGALTDIWWPQLASGQLLWLEDQHAGNNSSDPVDAWSLKDMDLASGNIRVLAHDQMPKYGGHMYVERIRFDGQRVGLQESLANGLWQIEVRDLSGRVEGIEELAGDAYDFALTTDGIIYSVGKANEASGAIGQMHLWHWSAKSGRQLIGPDAYQVNADGNLAAWVLDPVASKNTSGWFGDQRLYVATAPSSSAQPISPDPRGGASIGLDGMACGSGTVAWWERESYAGNSWLDTLTLWQPGWSSPIQVDTEGNTSYFLSLRGNWLIWPEENGRGNSPLLERIRGVPLSLLEVERPAS
jgi:hypothetical protein